MRATLSLCRFYERKVLHLAWIFVIARVVVVVSSSSSSDVGDLRSSSIRLLPSLKGINADERV